MVFPSLYSQQEYSFSTELHGSFQINTITLYGQTLSCDPQDSGTTSLWLSLL